MAVGQSFIVTTESARQDALKAARTLFRAGVIESRITSRKNEDGTFKIVAL